MKPVVVLDSNSLYGRKPLTNANSRLVQALAKSGEIRLVLPDIVLRELARQWAEEAGEHATKLATVLKALNETLDELDDEALEVRLPPIGPSRFYENAKNRLESKGVEMPMAPSVPVEKLLDKDRRVKKPFDREGRGFRDALIWETIRALCEDVGEGAVLMIFVTDNHKDFCEKKGGRLHPDLRQELADDRDLEVLPSLYELLQHAAISPLADTHHALESQLQPDRLQELVESAVQELQGRDVEDAVGVYIGSGMYDIPVSAGTEGATFDEIAPDHTTLKHEVFRDGDESTIRIEFEADCSFDGFVDKSDYFMDDGEGYALLADWNDHMFRVSTSGRVRFALSGTVAGTDLGGLALTLDDAADVA